MVLRNAVLLAVLTPAFAQVQSPVQPGLVVLNARVYTFDAHHPGHGGAAHASHRRRLA